VDGVSVIEHRETESGSPRVVEGRAPRIVKLIQLITRRQLRGAEVFALQLSEALSDQGCEVILASLYEPGSPPLVTERIRTVDLAGGAAEGLRAHRLLRLARLFRRERPDLVQANGSDTLKYAVVARWLAGHRFPVVYRNISLASDWLRSRVHWAWNRWLVAQVDHIAAVSDLTHEDFAATYGVNGGRITTIPIGTEILEDIDRRAARERLGSAVGIEPEDPVVAHIGSFTPEKNHAGIVRAFRRVHDAVPGSRLVLFGDGPLRPSVEALVAREGLEGSVRLAGARPDAARLVAGADLLVLFSSVEGLPGVVLEAAAGAVPTVSSRVGGVEEAVVDGHTGILVPEGDERALGRELVALLRDRARRETLGRNAREFVSERYGLDRVSGSFIELYRQLLADGH